MRDAGNGGSAAGSSIRNSALSSQNSEVGQTMKENETLSSETVSRGGAPSNPEINPTTKPSTIDPTWNEHRTVDLRSDHDLMRAIAASRERFWLNSGLPAYVIEVMLRKT